MVTTLWTKMEILLIQFTTFTGDIRLQMFPVLHWIIDSTIVRPSLFLSSNLGSHCQHSVPFYAGVNRTASYDWLYPTPLFRCCLCHANTSTGFGSHKFYWHCYIIYQRSNHIFTIIFFGVVVLDCFCYFSKDCHVIYYCFVCSYI